MTATTPRSTYSGDGVSRQVEQATRLHPGIVAIGRLGWVAKGFVYGLVGVLAVPIAIQGFEDERAGQGGGEASQLGAVAKIADTSFGAVALWLIAIGLALYVLWRVISIFLPAENSAKTWLTRGGYLVSAIMYSILAWTALSFATSDRGGPARGQTEDAKVERFTRDLMDMSLGRWLVGALGVCLVGVGIYFVIKGLMAKFRDELEPQGVGPVSHEAIVTLGRIGWVGRGIVMALVGWFLTSAAIQFKPSEAKGFDGSLREVTDTTLGPFVVLFAAVALALYGLFCVISAPRQRLTGAD